VGAMVDHHHHRRHHKRNIVLQRYGWYSIATTHTHNVPSDTSASEVFFSPKSCENFHTDSAMTIVVRMASVAALMRIGCSRYWINNE
jgi:hypothetical protein